MSDAIKNTKGFISGSLPDERTWIKMVEDVGSLGIARAICDEGPRAGMAHTIAMVSAAGLAVGALRGADDDSLSMGKEVAEVFANSVREGAKQRQHIIDNSARQAAEWLRQQGAVDEAARVAGEALDEMRRRAH